MLELVFSFALSHYLFRGGLGLVPPLGLDSRTPLWTLLAPTVAHAIPASSSIMFYVSDNYYLSPFRNT